MRTAIHFLFSAYFLARCIACHVVMFVFVDSARLLTPLDDSSTSAFRDSKHLHIPSVSEFAFQWKTLHVSGVVLTRGRTGEHGQSLQHES